MPATAVPLVVAYPTLTAPAEPSVRVTDISTAPALWATLLLDADSCNVPVTAAPSPLMVTLALLGLPRVAPPVGLDSAMANVLLPENGVALLTVTAKVLGVASPSAQSRVPLAAVKSAPARPSRCSWRMPR